jgi:hypothetical protein
MSININTKFQSPKSVAQAAEDHKRNEEIARLAKQLDEANRIKSNKEQGQHLKKFVNGDPRFPTSGNIYAKTAREIVAAQVATTEVIDRLGNSKTVQTFTTPVTETVKYQIDTATGQVIGGYVGGHVGPPNQTFTTNYYNSDPNFQNGLAQKDPNIKTGNVGAHVTDAYGNVSNQVLTPEARLEHAQAAAAPGSTHVSDTQTQDGVGHTKLTEIAPPPFATPAFEREFTITTNPYAG